MKIVSSARKVLFLMVTVFCTLLISCTKNNTDSLKPNVVLSPNEFIDYTVNGTAYNFIKPTDIVFADTITESQTFINVSRVWGDRSPSIPNDLTRINYIKSGSALGSLQTLISFYTPQTDLYPYYTTSPTPVMVNITEYGIIGQYIAGNFSGLFIGAAPGNTQYNVTCNFRIKRRI